MTKIFNMTLLGDNSIKFVQKDEFISKNAIVDVISIDDFFYKLKQVGSDPNTLFDFDYKSFGKIYLKIQKLDDGVVSVQKYLLHVADNLLFNNYFISNLNDYFYYMDEESHHLPDNANYKFCMNNYKKILTLYSAKVFDVYARTGAINVENAPCSIIEFLSFFSSHKKSILSKYFRIFSDYEPFYGEALVALSLSNLFFWKVDKIFYLSLTVYASILFGLLTWAQNMRIRKIIHDSKILYDKMICDIKSKYFLMPDDEEPLMLTKK